MKKNSRLSSAAVVIGTLRVKFLDKLFLCDRHATVRGATLYTDCLVVRETAIGV